MLAAQLESLVKRQDDFHEQINIHGKVNGFTAIGARWNGINKMLKKKMHGFVYALKDGHNHITLSSQDVEPNHEAPLKLAEAAARTFKKP
jgi:hypothetical protein